MLFLMAIRTEHLAGGNLVLQAVDRIPVRDHICDCHLFIIVRMMEIETGGIGFTAIPTATLRFPIVHPRTKSMSPLQGSLRVPIDVFVVPPLVLGEFCPRQILGEINLIRFRCDASPRRRRCS